MTARRNRVLVLEADQQVLLELQQRLEAGGFETLASVEVAEVIELARTRHFDLLLVGDRPPAIVAAEVLHDLQCGRVPVRCAVIQTSKAAFDPDYFYSLGAHGAVPAWALEDIAEWVQEWLTPARKAAGV